MSLLFWHPRGQREADRAAATGVAEHTDGRHGPGHWRTGAIGGEVLRRLVAEGVQVCAAAHTPAKAAPLEHNGIATVALDLDRPDTWLPALDGIEQVFFVGYAGPRFAETLGALAAAARRAGARRLVKRSRLGADVALELLELCVLIGLGDRASRPTGLGRPRSPGVGLLLLVVWGALVAPTRRWSWHHRAVWSWSGVRF